VAQAIIALSVWREVFISNFHILYIYF